MLEAFHSNTRPGLWASLATKLNSFAKESGLVQRISKHFSPEGFLFAMLEATSTGRASHNQLVSTLGWQSASLGTSPQALHQRINRTECGVEGFLMRCLSFICNHRAGGTPTDGGQSPFGRIIIEDLEKILSSHSGDMLDLDVKLTAKGHAARLVAVRASRQETEKRRRERRAEAKRKGRMPDRKSLIRDGWHLMVTNVSRSRQSVTKLVAIYSQRWLIEIAFRAWKQAGNMAKALNRVSSPKHLKGLVLAGMITMAIGLKTGLSLARSKPNLRYSLEKMLDYIIARLVALRKITDLAALKLDPRHLQAQKRKRMSLNCRLLELLG